MGFLDFFKKNANEKTQELELFAPITGSYVSLSEIKDEVFSQGILGEGCGIIPSEGKLYAPADGEISVVADTRHAVGITTFDGVELLIHVGMDTVQMNGDGFAVLTSVGKKVKKGDLLLCFDIQKIKDAGCPIDTAFVVTDKGRLKKLYLTVNCDYHFGDSVGKLYTD